MRSRTLAVLALSASLAACGGEEEAPVVRAVPPDSSWLPGQGSLALAPAYLAIASRADAQGEQRLAAYLRRLELIDARRRAAKKKAREDALRKYREALRRAKAKYEAALRRAAEERARREAEALQRRREAEQRLKELLRKLRVDPGQECSVPEVSRQFDCVSGRLPIGKPKR